MSADGFPSQSDGFDSRSPLHFFSGVFRRISLAFTHFPPFDALANSGLNWPVMAVRRSIWLASRLALVRRWLAPAREISQRLVLSATLDPTPAPGAASVPLGHLATLVRSVRMNVSRVVRLFLVVFVLVLGHAVASSAQHDPDCDGPLIPYNQGGNPDLVQRCTDRRPYVPVAPPGGCVKPYADASVLLCEPGAPAALAPSRVELRPLLDYAMRSTIAQAALGHPGRELAYVNMQNLDDTEQAVVVEYAIQGRPGVIVHTYTLAPKTTRGVGLHGDPLFAGRPNVSVTAYFMGAGTMDLTWLRDGDFIETASKAGTIVPRVQ
jgi:hypothetical protein